MLKNEQLRETFPSNDVILKIIDDKKIEFRERLSKMGNVIHYANNFDNMADAYKSRLNRFQGLLNDISMTIYNYNVDLLDANDFFFQELSSFYSGLISRINFIDTQIENPEFISRNGFAKIDELLNEYLTQRGQDINLKRIEDIANRVLYALKTDYLIGLNGSPSKDLIKAQEIATDLISKNEFINSGIESIQQFKDFQVSNIDQALTKINQEFSGKSVGVIRWLIGGIFAFSIVIGVLVYDYLHLEDIGSNWQLILSMNLIGGSFFGYLTVFCFGNYKKMKQLKESYDFRATLANSFGLLLQVADEEQKKILYPKALDVIFRDLPETNAGQDVNINLPVTEIMKGISGK